MLNHAHSHEKPTSRRDFFRTLTLRTLGRRLHPRTRASPRGVGSPPLIAQIKKEITALPVRYEVNSHFHWGHTQGNHAYRLAEGKIDFIASEPTKQTMSDLAQVRLNESLAQAPQQIDALRAPRSKSTSSAERAFCDDQIRQLASYRAELQHYTLELPTITFAKSYVIPDKAHDLHIEFHGHTHTGKVAAGKRAGRSIPDLQKAVTVASLRSMQSDGYADFMAKNQYEFEPNFGPAPPLQDDVNTNIAEIYKNLDRL